MTRPSTLCQWALAAALSLLLPIAIRAGPSQGTIATPGGYAAACASAISTSSSFLPDVDLEAPFSLFPGQFSCQSQTAHAGSNGSLNSAQAPAGMGEIHLQAQNQSRLSKQFAVGAASGSWMDTMRIVDDALTGQSSVWLFQVDIDGTFSVGGGNALVQLNVAKDRRELSNRTTGLDDGQSERTSTDVQRVGWGRIGTGDRTVDDRVTFAVPFTYGQDFSWGIFATTMAGQSSWAPSLTNVASRASADFSHTMRYAGSLGVLVDGELRTDARLVSVSGFDWRGAPEPDAALLAAGATRRRQRP